MLEIGVITTALKEILTNYPSATGNRAQFKALLLDYLPNERMTQNILLMALDENIVSELAVVSSVDNVSFYRYVKTLTTGYGVSEEYARAAVRAWSEALGIEIKQAPPAEKPRTPTAPGINWQDTADDGSYEYDAIGGGIRITKYTGFDEPVIVIPNMIAGNKVLEIGNNAFRGCASVEKVVISEGIETIGNGAFCYIKTLKEVIIPSTIESIGIKDTTRHISRGNNSIDYVEGTFEFTGIVRITLPDSVRFLGNHAFCVCESLKAITLSDSLTVINAYTFINAIRLVKITLPKNLKIIDISAFCGCSSLPEIVLPDGVEEIGDSAFCGCNKLTKITIPSSVRKIGSKQIGDEVFGDKHGKCPVTIYCDPGSYAMDYARRNGIKYAKEYRDFHT